MTYGGSCASSCPSSQAAVRGKAMLLRGEAIGCTGIDLCCVDSCKSKGGTCLYSSQKSSCSKPDVVRDCENGNWFYDSFCCLQDKCATTNPAWSCKMISECQSPSTDNGLNAACNAMAENSVCCQNDSAKFQYCDDMDPNRFYCSSTGCNSGGASNSTFVCKNRGQDPNLACCDKTITSPIGTPTATPTNTSSPTSQPYSFTNPLRVTSFTQLFFGFLGTVQTIVGWLSVIFIVLGGLMYIVSAGTGMANTARATIQYALIGFILAVAAPTLIKEIWDLAQAGASGGSALGGNSLQKILLNFLNFLLSLVGMLALVGFVISGIMYVTSAGSGNADSAKKAATYSIIAVALSGGAMIIVRQLLSLLYGQG